MYQKRTVDSVHCHIAVIVSINESTSSLIRPIIRQIQLITKDFGVFAVFYLVHQFDLVPQSPELQLLFIYS